MMGTATDIDGYDTQSYFSLVECGILAPDDRVELLEGSSCRWRRRRLSTAPSCITFRRSCETLSVRTRSCARR